MPTIETIKRLIIQARSDGVEKTAADLKKLADAQTGVAVASEKTSKVTLSAENALKRQERALDGNYRATEQMRRATRDLDLARAQGLISTERHAQLLGMAEQRYVVAAGQAGVFRQALSGVHSQLTAVSGGMGPVGVGLASFGPWGLAAGVGLSAVFMGLNKVRESAHGFADEMGKVGDLSQTLGMTTLQLQALNDEGAKFALTEEKIGSVMQRFTAQMDEMRRGTGDLFETIRRIDPALAKEMMLARDNAEAFDLLGKVYEKAGDARQKLDRVIAGRGGGTVGLLIQEISKQGGLDQTTAAFARSGDAIDTEMIAKVRLLKREIDDMSKDASTNLASIFSVPVLQAEYTFISGWRDLTRVAREFSISSDMKIFLSALASPVTGLVSVLTPQFLKSKPTAAPADLMVAARQNLAAGIQGGKNTDLSNVWQPSPKSDALTLEAQIAKQREFTAAMGTAATASDRLAQRKLELDMALKNNIISQEQYNRALGMESAQESLSALSRRIGLLGDMAPVSDIVLQKQKEINLANAQGAGITRDETLAIVAKTKAQAEYAKLPNRLGFERDQLGRNEMDAAVASRLRSEGLPIDFSSEAANSIRLTEQLKVTKDLTTDIASGGLKDLRNSLMNGATAWEALGQAGTNALGKLSDKLADMAVNQLVSKAFSSTAGGGFNIGNLFGFGPSAQGTAGFGSGGGLEGMAAVTLRSGGMVGSGGALTYVHPAYFENAPHFDKGGMIGEDGVPIVAHRGERVLNREETQMWNSGGGQSQGFTYNDNRTFNDVTPDVMAKLEARFRAERPKIKQEVLSDMRKQRGANPNFYSPG